MAIIERETEIVETEPSYRREVSLPDPRLTPGDILLLAADEIEEHGWTRLKEADAHGRHCVWGAIQVVAPDLHQASRAMRVLTIHLGQDPIGWNDHDVPREPKMFRRTYGGAYVAKALRNAAQDERTTK